MLLASLSWSHRAQTVFPGHCSTFTALTIWAVKSAVSPRFSISKKAVPPCTKAVSIGSGFASAWSHSRRSGIALITARTHPDSNHMRQSLCDPVAGNVWRTRRPCKPRTRDPANTMSPAHNARDDRASAPGISHARLKCVILAQVHSPCTTLQPAKSRNSTPISRKDQYSRRKGAEAPLSSFGLHSHAAVARPPAAGGRSKPGAWWRSWKSGGAIRRREFGLRDP
jgi:hypothetical protein